MSKACAHFGMLLVLLLLPSVAQTATFYADDDGPNDPGPGNPLVSDPLEDGSTDHPFDTVQEAIDASTNGDEVIVHPGTYDPIDFDSKNILVRSLDPGDPAVVQTTIVSGGSSPYSSGTVVMASDGTLDGLTVRNGTIGVSYADSERGAYSPTVTHCVITGCYYGIKGYVHYHPASIAPIFRNNVITGRLGGIWLDHQAISGGVHAQIQNNVIIGIDATFGRGIVYRMHESLPVVTQNIITDWDKGIDLVYSSLAAQRKALMTYNNVWGNTIDYHENGGGGAPQPFDLTGQQGNISADPLWQDESGDDYHLLDGSPCIDAGDPSFSAVIGETDFDGEDRVRNCSVDIGPDESPFYRDCNSNSVPDACEVISPGDFDADSDVDLDDYRGFVDCLSGPGTLPAPPMAGCTEACLAAFDFDDDQDVDARDFAALQALFGE
ncbi:MAG: DUF1565 domain-containing protein [bacterium]|nr:DUF1565 domain-containing protein [bacterium]